MRRLQFVLLLVALVALALWALGASGGLAGILRAYLVGYLAWLGTALGCLVLLLAYHIMGGRWLAAVGEALEAGARTLPLLALLFLPLLLDLEALFPWLREAYLAEHEVVTRKLAYLNEPFFLARAVLYWAVWLGLALALTTPRRRLGRRPRRRGLAAVGAIAWTLTASFAAFDWWMSLEPTFYASSFGMTVIGGMAAAGFAFAVLATLAATEASGRRALLHEERLTGLGSILLALVLLWGYVVAMQWLVIWTGNIPHRAEWYVRRGEPPWAIVMLLVALLHGVLPLVVLLSSRARASWRVVGALAALVLAGHALETAWLTAPAFHAEGPARWAYAAAVVALGGLWLAAAAWQIEGRGRSAALALQRQASDG